MKKLFLDKAEVNECVSVFVRDAEVIPAGTTVYAMPVSDRNSEYERYANQYDIHFIFDDNIPEVDFYTVPWIDIMAVDSDGGFIGTIGQMCDLWSEAPICYIDSGKRCYIAAENGAEFLEKAADWKAHLQPYEDVMFYRSKADAQKVLEFVDLNFN